MKKVVRKLLNKFGWEITSLNSSRHPTRQLFLALNRIDADVVFDIGANIGQFSRKLRSAGFKDWIISFEPLSSAHSVLTEVSQDDPKWRVHQRTAIGNQCGEIVINVAGNSVSSSILPILEAHYSAAPSSSYVSTEVTKVVSLDSVALLYLSEDSRLFLKIDAQGFEGEILNGAAETLKRSRGVLIELSLVRLYEGRVLWLEIIRRMDEQGFRLWAIQRGFTDPYTGQSLQLNVIFLRQEFFVNCILRTEDSFLFLENERVFQFINMCDRTNT